MAKLKSIAFAVGIMLLIGAVLCLYFSLRNLSSIRPASAYEDMGVHTFVPEEVYPVQREPRYRAAEAQPPHHDRLHRALSGRGRERLSVQVRVWLCGKHRTEYFGSGRADRTPCSVHP